MKISHACQDVPNTGKYTSVDDLDGFTFLRPIS